MIIDRINSPKDLKKLSLDKLNIVAREIRAFLIEKISNSGGHLASNLGVVELTLALHYCFNSPRDKIIWDVGHQSYVHKILTGRKNKFDSLRKFKGISGFQNKMKINTMFLILIKFTSISAAMGGQCKD